MTIRLAAILKWILTQGGTPEGFRAESKTYTGSHPFQYTTGQIVFLATNREDFEVDATLLEKSPEVGDTEIRKHFGIGDPSQRRHFDYVREVPEAAPPAATPIPEVEKNPVGALIAGTVSGTGRQLYQAKPGAAASLPDGAEYSDATGVYVFHRDPIAFGDRVYWEKVSAGS